MGFLAAIVLLSISGAIIVGTIWRLRQTRARWSWWITFGVLTVIGFVVGGWITANADYHVSPKMRFCSFPIPLAFLRLEDGAWVDYITPPEVMYPGMIANTSSIVAMSLLPLMIALVAFQKKA